MVNSTKNYKHVVQESNHLYKVSINEVCEFDEETNVK